MVDITPEQKAKLDQETQEALKSMADKQKATEVEKIKSDAKAEAQKEFALEQKLKDQEAQMQKFIAEQEKLKKESAEHLAALQAKFEEAMSQKRAPVVGTDPFAQPDTKTKFLQSLTQEKIDQIEEASARAFYGDELYEEIQKKK